jgi:hypothetical protein
VSHLHWHRGDCFFKYVTEIEAKRIIKDHTLRWSCPLDFNDPFDHQISFIDEDRAEALYELFTQRFQTYVSERDDIKFDMTHPFGQILTLYKQMCNVIPKEEFFRRAEKIKIQVIQSIKRALAGFNEETRRERLNTRVLCLAEENDNLLMWSHYSASHAGAVVKLNVIEELEVPLLVAQKVRYSNNYPLLATEEEWIDHVLCINRIDLGQRELDLILVKGEDWSYEKEWRLSMTSEEYSLRGAIYLKEPPQVFGAVYLGCRMHQEDKKEIIELAIQSLPDMEIWQVVQGQKAYKIEFEKIR